MPTTIHRHPIRSGSTDDLRFRKFMAPPREPGRTLDRVAPPDVTFRLELAETLDLSLPYRLPDGSRKLRMWAIADPSRAGRFPSELLRVREGQTVHATVTTSKSVHTIHWHGIEPSPMNDGVGKHSFEIKDRYTYQFTPRGPGLFFYHCHVNTPLHFEMGLVGALVVDPARGPGWVAAYNPPGHLVPSDVEALWVLTAHDPRWHVLGPDHAFMHDPAKANDPRSFTSGGILHDWRPRVFTISGAVARDNTTPITDRRAAVSAAPGQTILLRVLNASYTIARITVGAPATVIAQDGRPLGVPPYGRYSAPRQLPANTPILLNTAQRHDVLVRPAGRGTIPCQVDYLDWRGYGLRGRARTTITVS
jgi:FtsP/CotA-like multicopper oxidase with cupredoxin domain